MLGFNCKIHHKGIRNVFRRFSRACLLYTLPNHEAPVGAISHVELGLNMSAQVRN